MNVLQRNVEKRADTIGEPPRLPRWAEALNDEDWAFLKRFLLSSGSLKALAKVYEISYPTVRGRLDRLIAKVEAAEDVRAADVFERKLRILIADAAIPASIAKELLAAHRTSLKQRQDQ